MRISLAAIGLTILAYPLAVGGPNWLLVGAYLSFGAGVLIGVAGAVHALVNRRMPTGTRIAAFVLGLLPLALIGFMVIVIANMPYD